MLNRNNRRNKFRRKYDKFSEFMEKLFGGSQNISASH